MARAEEIFPIARATDHAWSWLDAVGTVSALSGDHERAVKELRQAVAVSDRSNVVGVRPFAAAPLSWTTALAGQVDDAVPLLEGAIAQAEAMRLLAQGARWVSVLAEAHLLAGRWEEASLQSIRSLDLSRRLKERGSEAWALWVLGEIAARREPPDRRTAAARLQEARSLAAELGMRRLGARCALGLERLTGAPGDAIQRR